MTRKSIVKLLACSLLALGLGAANGFAQALDLNIATKPDAFHDLPGVKMPEDINPPPISDNCTRAVRKLPQDFDSSNRDVPVLVYECEQGGLTFESTLRPFNQRPNDWSRRD